MSSGALAEWPALLATVRTLVMRVSALMDMVTHHGHGHDHDQVHLLSHPELESVMPGQVRQLPLTVIFLLTSSL